MNNKKLYNYVVDIIILFAFILLSINGSIIQLIYHLMHHDVMFVFLGLNQNGWLLMHKVLSVIIGIGITVHICLHLNWVKDVFKNNRLFNKKYKNKSLIYLFIVYTISAVLGFVSWFFNNSIMGYRHGLRHVLVEIHDKLVYVLIVLSIIHIIKKFKFLSKTTKEIFN